MIHTVLQLTRPFIVPDTETTGVDPQTDRIIELGFQIFDANGLKSEWRSLINPLIPIPPESTKKHGITDEMMKGCRVCGGSPPDFLGEETYCSCEEFKPIPTFAQVAPLLAKGFSNCDYGGKNVLRFDLAILGAEFARAKVPWSYAGARILDADRLEQLAVPRTLEDLHEKYTGKKHEGAHGAMSDVRATSTVLVAQLTTYPERLPHDLDQLHALQWPGLIDSRGKFRFDKDGVPKFTNWGKHKFKRMDAPDVNRPDPRSGQNYWDFMLSSDFTPEEKAIAAAAKLGKFPTQKAL